jgi:hypothetical protein
LCNGLFESGAKVTGGALERQLIVSRAITPCAVFAAFAFVRSFSNIDLGCPVSSKADLIESFSINQSLQIPITLVICLSMQAFETRPVERSKRSKGQSCTPATHGIGRDRRHQPIPKIIFFYGFKQSIAQPNP